MSFHPWFPRDSIDSLCSWQPGVSKVTPAGRIRTTDLPDRVKLAAQQKASCNICEQSQIPLNFFSLALGSVASLSLLPFLPSSKDLGQESLQYSGKAWLPRRLDSCESCHGKACSFSGVCGPAPLFAPVRHSKSAWHSPLLRNSHPGIRRLGNLSGFECTTERGLGGES